MKPHLTYRHTRFACYIGYITQGIVNNLTPLLFVIFREQSGVTYEQLGRLILLNFGTQLLVDLLSVRLLDRIGYRTAAVLAHIMAGAGLLFLGILPRVMPSYIGLMIAVVTYAIGGGLIEVLISPMLEALPSDKKAADMSLLHSFYCWGQVLTVLISTLALLAVGSTRWTLLPLFWSIIPFFGALIFLFVPLGDPVPEETRTPLGTLLKSRIFWLSLLMMTCAGASELAMSQWSSLFAERGLQLNKAMGDLLGPCLFAALMGIGRTIYAVLGDRLPLERALRACAVLCAACYAVTVLSPWPLLSLVGCAVCGLSVSLMWPGVYSLSAARFPTGGTALFSMLALFGDLGCSIGPWISGMVSDAAQTSTAAMTYAAQNGLSMDQVGLKLGLAVIMIFPLAMLAGLFPRKKR